MAIAFNDNLNIKAPKPIDARYGKLVSNVWKPFDSINEALSLIIYRYEGLILPIRASTNKIDLYWFEGGVADSNLTLYKANTVLTDYYTKNQVDTILLDYATLDNLTELEADIDAHISDQNNPHNTTALQVGAIANQNAAEQVANYWINGSGKVREGYFGFGTDYTRVDRYGIFSPGGAANIGWNGNVNIFYSAALHNFYNSDQTDLFLHLGDGTASPLSTAPHLQVEKVPTLANDVVRKTELDLKENSSNKKTTLTPSDNVGFPTNKAAADYIATQISAIPPSGVSSVNGRAGAVTGLAEQSSLQSEIDRATAAEATKATSTALTTETNARIAADALKANQTDLATEISNRTAADTALQTNINKAVTLQMVWYPTAGQTTITPTGLAGNFPSSIIRGGKPYKIGTSTDTPTETPSLVSYNIGTGAIGFSLPFIVNEEVVIQYSQTGNLNIVPASVVTQGDFGIVKSKVDQLETQIFDISETGELLILDSNNNISFKIDLQGNAAASKLLLNKLGLGLNIEFFETDDYETVFVDSLDNILYSTNSGDSTFNAKISSVTSLENSITNLQTQINGKLSKFSNIELFETDDYEFVQVDSYGNLLFAIEQGSTQLKANFGNVIPTTTYTPTYGQIFDIEYNPLYGQSLSVGTDASNGVILSTTQRYSNLMFKGGMRFWDGPSNTTDLTDFLPGIENISPNTSNLRETSNSGAMNMFIQRITDVKGIVHNAPNYDYALLGASPGFGGKSIVELSKGTIYYQRFLDSVTAGKNIAKNKGKTFGIRCVYWVHGDNNAGGDPEVYKAALKKLRLDLNTDIKTIIGVNQPDIPIIMYQFCQHNFYNANPTIGLAQLDLAKNEAGFFMSNPGYFLEYSSDNRHLSNYGNLHNGVYLGKQAFDHLISSNTSKPFIAQSFKIFGNIVEVVFNPPSGNLVFDTTTITSQTNMGFNIIDSGIGTITILSLSITRPNTIRFIMSRDIVTGDKLTYAQNGVKGSTTLADQAKGNLRDNTGETLIYNPTGDNYKVHNWVLMHDITF